MDGGQTRNADVMTPTAITPPATDTGMSGLDWSNTALDAGKFGLGVASYFQNKPILKEQLTSLKQGNEIGREKIDAWKRHDLAMRNAGLRD